MPRRIIFKTREINFPPRCVVCRAPSVSDYTVERTVIYANRSIPVSISVPMCAQHYQASVQKGPREQLMNRIGLSVGAVFGGLVVVGLLRLWSVTGQGIPLLNLFVAGFVGLSMFMLIWSATTFFIAPLFAGPEVIAARHAVRILRFWPRSDQIQLEFQNEAAADEIAAANPDLVVLVH